MKDAHSTYYRWAYSPTTADVNFSANGENGPLSIRTYSDLANERPEKDLMFGYAIRTPQGWNLFDSDDKAIEDPNMIWSIRNAIEQ